MAVRLVALLLPVLSWQGAAFNSPHITAFTGPRVATLQRRYKEVRMILGAPTQHNSRTPFGFWTPAPKPEVMHVGRSRVDFMMQSLGVTRRRVSGGLLVDAPADVIWQCLTNYEELPDFIPNILSNRVVRDKNGAIRIDQTSLLSRRLGLRTQMTLEAIESSNNRKLVLRRLSGHGFLEFEATYALQDGVGGKTYLSYQVELVPCPIFPLNLVEAKVRKEVPKMLVAFSDAATELHIAST